MFSQGFLDPAVINESSYYHYINLIGWLLGGLQRYNRLVSDASNMQVHRSNFNLNRPAAHQSSCSRHTDCSIALYLTQLVSAAPQKFITNRQSAFILKSEVCKSPGFPDETSAKNQVYLFQKRYTQSAGSKVVCSSI